MHKSRGVTLDSLMKVHVVGKPLIHIDPDEEDENFRGFVPEEIALIEEDISPFDFDYFNLAVNYITHKKGYFPGMSLGSNKSRVPPVTNSKAVENLFS